MESWVVKTLKLPQRRRQRLRNYDYSQNGAYFVTICTYRKLYLFGKVENGAVELNKAGLMVSTKFAAIPTFYPGVEIDQFVVMPNHLHGLIILHNENITRKDYDGPTKEYDKINMGLPHYIQRFKSLTTRLYIGGVREGHYPPFRDKIWQKSYHDRIVRNEREYLAMAEYIQTNPLRWELDKYFIG
jgi:putative transposase